MTTTILTTFAVFFWACESVILEKKLSHISPIASIAFYYLGNVVLGFLGLFLAKNMSISITMPNKDQYYLVVLCGLLLFCTDICYLWAYKKGGSVMSITTVTMLLPVFASIIKVISGGPCPTTTQVIGWGLAATGVFLVTK